MENFFQWMLDFPYWATLLIFAVSVVILACVGWTTHSIEVGEFKIYWSERDETPFSSACLHGIVVIVFVTLIGMVPLVFLEASAEDGIGFINSVYGIIIYVTYGIFIILRMICAYIKYSEGESNKALSIGSLIGVVVVVGVVIGVFFLVRVFSA